MSAGETYDQIRLEEPDGTVICYFAPTFEVVPQDQNDVFETPRGSEREAVVRDNGLWTSELQVQGAFVHSEEAPPAFRDALQDVFGQQTVTPDDQINRLRAHTVYSASGAKHFYHRDTEYVAHDDADLDIANGTYPVVAVSELRVPENGETSTLRADFMVRMSVGVER